MKLLPGRSRDQTDGIYYGGEGEIRTHGTRKGSTVFETARFNHSRTSPRVEFHCSRTLYLEVALNRWPPNFKVSLRPHWSRTTNAAGSMKLSSAASSPG